MEDMDELEQICFEIISYVGTAKSCYVNSIAKAKEGDFGGVRCRQEDAAAAPPPRRGSDGECRDLQAHGAELRRHLS